MISLQIRPISFSTWVFSFVAARYKPAFKHLLVCLIIASLVFCILWFIWYPGSFWHFSDGQHLFLMIVAIDVILGPALTFVVSHPNKAKKVLVRDIVCIALVQLAGLIYGVYTVYIVRPVFMVFAVDRFNVVSYSDLDPQDIALAEKKQFSSLSLFGPVLVSTRRADPSSEILQMIENASKGKDVELQPKFYQPYSFACPAMQGRLGSLKNLALKNASLTQELDKMNKKYGGKDKEFGFLPVVARSDWVAVVQRSDCKVVDYYKLNGF